MIDLTENETRAKASRQLVEMVRHSKLFREYEQVFALATGLPLALQPLEYWQLVHHGKRNENPFCALLAENPKTLAVCLEVHENAVRDVGPAPVTMTCPFGLAETAVPLRLGEETVGYLRVGQVLRHSPRASEMARTRREIERVGARFTPALRRAWEKSRLIPAERYQAMVRLLAFFAEQLSALGNQLLMEAHREEPPAVAKARHFIEQHRTEAITLAAVAAASGASIFHFCKIFHRSTGLKFTDYVARVRADAARTKLLNPNLRISEVAYDAGFQSLTQFNRTFKRVFGLSPSEFRARLHPTKQSPARRARR